MAKQSGIHQLRGKVGNMKYYTMKGVQGGLVQSINEGMSERVKNGAEYANTRRNNSEFGMAASTAGAIIKSCSQRWRYILKPFSTGLLAKDLLNFTRTGSSAAWGSRSIDPNELQAGFGMIAQRFVKNDVTDFGDLTCSITSADEGATLDLIGENLHNEKAEAAGCTGVRCVFVGGALTPSYGGTATEKAVPAMQQTDVLTEIDVPFGNDVEQQISAPIIASALGDVVSAAIGYVVLLPYREIGGEKVVMQEFASAIFA